jgi:hypothetical protein
MGNYSLRFERQVYAKNRKSAEKQGTIDGDTVF